MVSLRQDDKGNFSARKRLPYYDLLRFKLGYFGNRGDAQHLSHLHSNVKDTTLITAHPIKW